MTKELELTHQRDEMNKLLQEVEYEKTKGTICQLEYDKKRQNIILGYRDIVTQILLDNK